MSNAEKKCVFCNAYLFEDDDVVYCPECGAPHHRECYFKIGECALKGKHGTGEEYKRAPASPDSAEQNKKQPDNEYQQTVEQDSAQGNGADTPFGKFDFNFPKVDPEFNLDDTINGVKIRKLMSFIFVNPVRYIRKFLQFSKGGKVSWNWLAFLFPSQWLILRKQYKTGILAFVLCLASVVLALPLSAQLGEIYYNTSGSYYDLFYNMMLSIDATSLPIFACAIVGTLLDAAIRVVFGLFGDKLYYSHVFSKLEDLSKQEDFEDSTLTLRRAGGVNPWAALVCMMVLEYSPVIIGSFIL